MINKTSPYADDTRRKSGIPPPETSNQTTQANTGSRKQYINFFDYFGCPTVWQRNIAKAREQPIQILHTWPISRISFPHNANKKLTITSNLSPYLHTLKPMLT